MLAAVALSPAARAQPAPATNAVVAHLPAASGDLQFADEIVRRLRRLGINFNRARIERPYDPVGELC